MLSYIHSLRFGKGETKTKETMQDISWAFKMKHPGYNPILSINGERYTQLVTRLNRQHGWV